MLHQCYHKARKRSYRQEKETEMVINNNTDLMGLPNSDNDTPTALLKKELTR